ncbi:MAG: hypothetical protein ACRDSK_05060 [Actinophytocola sp.]|uniref:hypothetical protein n=1 Tax=Actinophytocola sp. TaxID=1872138 RepID=UPI003D6A4FDA
MEANQTPPVPDSPSTVGSPGTRPPLPAELKSRTATEVRDPDVNAPMPPGLREAGVRAPDAFAAGWVNNRMITHLWSYDAPTGVWVWVDGIGWKRLSPVSQFGHTHMTVLATLATQRNQPVDYHEDASGQIDQILV